MLNFLNPAVLIALAATAIPLIIHFLNRHKKKEIHFSTVHFLKQMVRKEMRRLKLRQIFLLIIRTLIIAFLVIAFSRPTLQTEGSLIPGRTAMEIAIVIDNSMSLNSLELSGNLLERIRQKWFDLSAVFQGGDRITVIMATDPMQILAERENFSLDFWENIAREIQPSSYVGDLQTAVYKAFDIFEDSPLANRELYIISDFQIQEDGLGQLQNLQSGAIKGVRVFGLPVFHTYNDNISLDSAWVVNQILEKNQLLELKINVKNRNQNKDLSTMVSLILDKSRVAQQKLDLTAGESRTLKFETLLNQTGYIEGYAELENDALLEDNRFFINFYVPRDMRILHILPDSQFESFLPIILKPAVDQNIFSYRRIFQDQWVEASFIEYQVIILEGLESLPPGFINRLLQSHERSVRIVVIPGSRVDQTGYNHLLRKLKIGQILALKRNEGQSSEFVSLGELNWEHPIFKGLFEQKRELNPITFHSYYVLKSLAAAEALISFRNGDPYLIAGEDTDKPSFFMAAPLQPDWTNLVVRGFIVPLIFRTLYYAEMNKNSDRMSITIGENYTGIFHKHNPPYNYQLKRPNGYHERLSPDFRGTDLLLRVRDNDQLGNYQIWQDDELISVYSVNHSSAESIPEYYTESDVAEIFHGLIWMDAEDDLQDTVKTGRFGRELWPYFLGLVMFLLLIEMALAHTGQSEKRKGVQPQDSSI